MGNDLSQTGLGQIGIQGISGPTINVTQIIGMSYEYNDLLDKLNTQQKLFDRTPEDETQERLEISAKINDFTDQIEQFKQDVLKLAEAFQNIEINTDRLKRAKEFFDKGEIGEARAVLETELEQMQSEQKHLLREREHYESETLPKLQNNSEEFYLLALSTRSDYTNPNRFSETCQYFQSSIESYPTKSNVSDYAYFLWEHNEFPKSEYYCNLYLEKFKKEITRNEYAMTLNNLANLHIRQNRFEDALKEFEEALKIRRQLAESDPEAHLPAVAGVLNNIAGLHWSQNRYEESLSECEEALQIRRQLAKKDPQTYLPDIAEILNNIATLHQDQNRYEEASMEYEEALQIRRRLVETNPQTYLSYVAKTLNNLAGLHKNQNKYEEALKEFEEALQIRRQLAESNPHAYLPDVAGGLNNIAGLHWNQNRYEEASKEYEEALKIYRQLAETNPQTYVSNVAMTLNNLANLHRDQNKYAEALDEYEEALQIRRRLYENMPDVYAPKISNTLKNISIFYQESVPDREKSIAYAVEAVMILLLIVEKVPYTQKYLETAMAVLADWGLNAEEIEKLVEEKREK